LIFANMPGERQAVPVRDNRPSTGSGLARFAFRVTANDVLHRLLRLVFVVTLIVAPATMRAQDAQAQDARAQAPGMAIDCHDTSQPKEHGPKQHGQASKIDCAALCTATLPDQAPGDFADFHGAALIVALPTRNLRCHLLEVATPPPKPGENRQV
jgi:hypothetical protein